MTKHNNFQLIQNVTEALLDSVPNRRHEDVLAALKRCQEMIGKLASTVVDLDTGREHGELMLEAKLFANVLAGFFGDTDRDWFDITKGYNPRDYLTNKGAIKTVHPVRVQMEERFAADRKAKQEEVDRIISDFQWKSAQQALKRAQRNLDPVRARTKRGRPVGSKNKPKTGGSK